MRQSKDFNKVSRFKIANAPEGVSHVRVGRTDWKRILGSETLGYRMWQQLFPLERVDETSSGLWGIAPNSTLEAPPVEP